MHGLWGALGGLAVFHLLRRRERATALLMFTAAVGLHAAWDRWVGFPPRQDQTTRVIAHGLFAGSFFLYTRQLRATGIAAVRATSAETSASPSQTRRTTPPSYRPQTRRRAHAA